MTSDGRVACAMRLATCARSASPTSWPAVSLTSFSRSRSRNSIATDSRAAQPVERVGRVAQQQRPVRQPGQRVVRRLAEQLALHVVAIGDVARHATPVLDDAVRTALDDEVDVERPLESVGPAEPDLAGPLRGERRLEQLARHLVADRLHQPADHRVADEVDRVADPEQLLRGVFVYSGAPLRSRMMIASDDGSTTPRRRSSRRRWLIESVPSTATPA